MTRRRSESRRSTHPSVRHGLPGELDDAPDVLAAMKRHCTPLDLHRANVSVVEADALIARLHRRVAHIQRQLGQAHEALAVLLELRRSLDRYRDKVVLELQPELRHRLQRRLRTYDVTRS